MQNKRPANREGAMFILPTMPNMTLLHFLNTLDKHNMSIEIQKADVIIFNMGLHQRSMKGADMSAYFDSLGKLLYNQTRNSSKQVIIRSTTSQHFISKNGDGFYLNRIKSRKKCANNLTNPSPHYTNYYLREMAKKYHFQYLDNFPILYGRGDLMVGLTKDELDCTHYCYSPEIIWPELVLLTQLISK